MASCSDIPNAAPTNAGIAGPGVLLSFIIAAFVALILSSIVVLGELRQPTTPPKLGMLVCRRLLASYSDQQLFVGVGIQAVGLAMAAGIVPYQLFLIWMLSLLSMSVHLASLLALVNDFRRDWLLRWLRQGLMAVNLALSSVYGVLVLRAVSSHLEDSAIPVSCLLAGSSMPLVETTGNKTSLGLSWAATVLIITVNALTFVLATWYLHRRDTSRKAFKMVQLLGLAAMAVLAIGATVRAVLLSQAFGKPSVTLIDDGEKQWSFGQLLALLMLLFPLMSAVELWRGEMKVPAPVMGDKL